MKNRGCLGLPAPLFRSGNADGWYTPWGLLAALRNGFANSDRLFLPMRVETGDRSRYPVLPGPRRGNMMGWNSNLSRSPCPALQEWQC
ncbi:hypothetical protein K456DRAFT_52136 [Colletotrichum gloeosporioides 23]|nr:hypothetical protein K456DRAFT_52136 [Colletotrichum gloeosporioides 23]